MLPTPLRFWASRSILARSVLARTLLEQNSSGGENLLQNVGFEEVKNGTPRFWLPRHRTTLFEATAAAIKEGTRSSLLAKVAGSKGWTYVYQDVPVTPTATYKLSGWVRFNGEQLSKVSLRIDWLDALGAKVSKATAEVAASLRQEAFQLLELTRTAPEEARVARIELFANLSQPDPAKPALFDALWFGEVSDESDAAPVLSFTLPDRVAAGEEFTVSISVKNLLPNSGYWVKFLAAPPGGDFYGGRTCEADGETFLAWNAAWEKLPLIETDARGRASFEIRARIDADKPAGDYAARLRLREVGDGVNWDSSTKGLVVTAAEEDASAEDRIFSGSISEVKALDRGTRVKVRGVVTAPPGIFGDDDFYVRDQTAGIKIHCSEAAKCGLELGGEVELRGTLEESRDEYFIKLDCNEPLDILGSERDAPEPMGAETGDIGESFEGQLVSVSGKIVETSGSTFWIDDDSGRLKIHLKDSTGIHAPQKRQGWYARVVGIVSQWGKLDNGSPNYRVMPRFDEDLEILVASKGASSETPVEEGGVLGTTTELPVTGQPFAVSVPLGGSFLCLGLALRFYLYFIRFRKPNLAPSCTR